MNSYLSTSQTGALVSLDHGLPSMDLSPRAAAATVPIDTFARAACEAIAEYGCVRLVGAFPPGQMSALRRESDLRYCRYAAEAVYRDARRQGDRRTLITLEIAGGFEDPSFYANQRVYSIASRALGPGFILGHLAVILSRPGSKDQFVHRDTPSLFDDGRFDAFMPAVGIAIVLPLVTLDGKNGGTRVWPRSHRCASDDEARALPSVVAELELGSCLLFDVRLMHGGKGNTTDAMRSIVYGAYHRRWFRDWDGFEEQAPISISSRAFSKVPLHYRHLFDWRFDGHSPWRRRLILQSALNALPRPLLERARRIVDAP